MARRTWQQIRKDLKQHKNLISLISETTELLLDQLLMESMSQLKIQLLNLQLPIDIKLVDGRFSSFKKPKVESQSKVLSIITIFLFKMALEKFQFLIEIQLANQETSNSSNLSKLASFQTQTINLLLQQVIFLPIDLNFFTQIDSSYLIQETTRLHSNLKLVYNTSLLTIMKINSFLINAYWGDHRSLLCWWREEQL